MIGSGNVEVHIIRETRETNQSEVNLYESKSCFFLCFKTHTRLIVLVMGSGNVEVDIIRETG